MGIIKEGGINEFFSASSTEADFTEKVTLFIEGIASEALRLKR